MVRIVLAVLAALFVCIADASEPITVGLHTVTAHIGGDNSHIELNNRNFGLYVRDGPWVIGAYDNTIHRTSVYGGYVFEYSDFAATVGLISGYQRRRVRWFGNCDNGVTNSWCYRYYGHSPGWLSLLVSPSYVLLREANGAVRLNVIPKIGNLSRSTVLHLSFEWTFY